MSGRQVFLGVAQGPKLGIATASTPFQPNPCCQGLTVIQCPAGKLRLAFPITCWQLLPRAGR